MGIDANKEKQTLAGERASERATQWQFTETETELGIADQSRIVICHPFRWTRAGISSSYSSTSLTLDPILTSVFFVIVVDPYPLSLLHGVENFHLFLILYLMNAPVLSKSSQWIFFLSFFRKFWRKQPSRRGYILPNHLPFLSTNTNKSFHLPLKDFRNKSN